MDKAGAAAALVKDLGSWPEAAQQLPPHSRGRERTHQERMRFSWKAGGRLRLQLELRCPFIQRDGDDIHQSRACSAASTGREGAEASELCLCCQDPLGMSQELSSCGCSSEASYEDRQG